MQHRARKRLGQHFLNDKRILARIVEAVGPRPNETIIEIGPGQGSLTERLADRAARLVAIELDRDLATALRQRYADRPHVQIVEGDVLDIRLADLSECAPWSVIGNVPYYITTPILFHALASPRPRRIVLLVQREVGDRLSAAPGGEAYGALSVTAQAVARVERHGRVPAGSFQPKPAVDSVIVSLTPLTEPIVTADEEPAFKTLVQGAFSQRRKQMLRVVRSLFNIAAEPATALLNACGIDVTARPEVLAPQTFVDLLRAAKRAGLQQSPESSGLRSTRSRSDSTARN